MTSTELAPLNRDATSVVSVLERARTWLSTAVEMTGPEEIAAAKAHIRTAEVYAKELGLSKEIQTDAQEMVRRAEYALGKAIRKGQEEGAILRSGEKRSAGGGAVMGSFATKHSSKTRPSDYASHAELHGSGAYPGIMQLADSGSDAEFEEALTEAREAGSLSRANVIRKVKKLSGAQTRDQRADLIEDLAAQGYSSRQMPAKVGVSEESVRQIARDYGIEIPADRSVAGTRRINSTHVVVNTATALEGLVAGVDLIDYGSLDIEEVRQWATSLTDSMRTLNRFVKQIKEMTQ